MGVSTIHDLPDDSLRWILLRLASSLHPPTVVGQYHIHTSGDHRFVPSSSPIIDGSRFSVDDFLDKDNQYLRWHVADCHGGLVLLSMTYGPCAGSVPNLIVYGTREVFLLDGDDGRISVSNFKVLHRHLTVARAATSCVFSRGNAGEWGWRLLSRRLSDEDLYPCCSLYAAGRVDGSLYLGLLESSRIIAIDSTSLVFSMVDLPTRVDTSLFRRRSSSFTVVHGAGGLGPTLPQRASIVHVCGQKLELFRRVRGSGEWVLEHIIP
ncbi:uncharacterized protein [Miscanthus floridulus]|uniref:uncharacterized protein n=1 Tax=Miscanthus floridulus TaxID=154761 RepID=UPI0034582780